MPAPQDNSHDHQPSPVARNGSPADPAGAAASTGASSKSAYDRPAGSETDTRLVLIRHGESQVTVDRIIGGHRTCSGLSELGRRQADHLRSRLADSGELNGALLYSSTFPRAVQTAEIIAPALGTNDVEQDIGFGEHDPGPELDGVTFDEYVRRHGSPNWGGDPFAEVFPGGGETVAEFHLRVGAALSDLMQRRAGSTIVIACHGGVVDAVFRQLLRLPSTGSFDLWTLNTSLTEFILPASSGTHASKWRLVRYNDAAHLVGLPSATVRVGDRSDEG